MDTSIQKPLKMKKYIFCINAHTPIEKQPTQTEIPHPFKKQWSKCKCCIDLLVSYHDFQLMFLLPIVG